MTSSPAEHPYQPLLALAFDSAPGPSSNEAIAFHRAQREETGLMARSYEVVVPASPPPLRGFLDQLVFKLGSHLTSLRLPPQGAQGVFVSLFVEDRLYFINSLELFAFHAELRSHDPPVALLPGRRH